jgi:opacity protein-like surface antigen
VCAHAEDSFYVETSTSHTPSFSYHAPLSDLDAQALAEIGLQKTSSDQSQFSAKMGYSLPNSYVPKGAALRFETVYDSYNTSIAGNKGIDRQDLTARVMYEQSLNNAEAYVGAGAGLAQFTVYHNERVSQDVNGDMIPIFQFLSGVNMPLSKEGKVMLNVGYRYSDSFGKKAFQKAGESPFTSYDPRDQQFKASITVRY